MDALIKIRKIVGKEINPQVFELPEACFWMAWSLPISKLLRATKASNGEYEFTIGDITYVATKEDELAHPERYEDAIWRSVFELPFLKI
jgi:hypothetical protein